MKTIQCTHPPHHYNAIFSVVRVHAFRVHALLVLSTLLVLTLAMRELRHWSPIAGMLPQSHCGDEEDGHIGLSS